VDTIVTRAADIQLSLSSLMIAIIALALFRAGLGGESLTRVAVPPPLVLLRLAEWPSFARTGRAPPPVGGRGWPGYRRGTNGPCGWPENLGRQR